MASEEKPEQDIDSPDRRTHTSGGAIAENETVEPNADEPEIPPKRDRRERLTEKREEGPSPAELLNILEQFESSPPDFAGEIGGTEPNETPDVDIILHPSRDVPIAGELWSIAGEIYNRSQVPVWIIDTKTRLTLAPEMYGLVSKTGSLGAFFPTISYRKENEVVRIDPGAKYSVVWKIDPISEEGQPGADQPIYRRIFNSIRSFAFFNPGAFKVSSSVHVWIKSPNFNTEGEVNNLGDSYVMSVFKDVSMDASPWVIILGAACGAILCFILQILLGITLLGENLISIVTNLAVGLSSSVILSSVATVLVSRLAAADFLIVVKVKDIWGAITTGFIIQWLGVQALLKLIPEMP